MKNMPFILFILLLLAACRGDNYAEAERLYRQGLKLEQQNIPDSAVWFYRKASDLLEGSEHYELISEIYNQTGELLLMNNVFGKAMEEHQKALLYGNKAKQKKQVSRAYRGIGKVHFLQNKEKEALVYFKKALQISGQVGNREELSSVYNNLSNAYYMLDEYDKALEYNEKAIAVTADSSKIYRNYAVKGKIFALLHRYDSAYHYLLAASRCDNIRTQVSCFLKLSEMPPESGITDSMKYIYLNKGKRLQDSIERMDNAVKISEAEYQHQLDLLKSQDKHNLIYVILFSFLLALALFLYFYNRYKRRIRKFQEKIDRLYNEFGQKQEQLSENNDREKQIIEIISRTGNTCCGRFTASTYYKELKKKLSLDNYALTYAELDDLQKAILKEFDVYIQQLSSIVNLSANDSVLCCLSLLGFNTKECAACRGVSSETIRSQKTRIKKRIPKTFFNNGLFNVIFGEES